MFATQSSCCRRGQEGPLLDNIDAIEYSTCVCVGCFARNRMFRRQRVESELCRAHLEAKVLRISRDSCWYVQFASACLAISLYACFLEMFSVCTTGLHISPLASRRPFCVALMSCFVVIATPGWRFSDGYTIPMTRFEADTSVRTVRRIRQDKGEPPHFTSRMPRLDTNDHTSSSMSRVTVVGLSCCNYLDTTIC